MIRLILLTISVIVASAERLNGLAILCIENDMLEKIEFENIIDDFASQNARRRHFQ